VVLDSTLGIAIITGYHSFCVLELWRHWLTINCAIQVSKLSLHIDCTLVTYRALIGTLHVFIVACFVDTVTAQHEDHRRRRSEHIFTTNWTVAVRDTLDAFVGVLN
jgi:hypothetical protein